MKTRMMLSVVFLGVILSVFAGCVQTSQKMKLNLSPQRETTYKVVMQSSKDYSFIQPSVNKTKERHTSWWAEMVFTQKIEKVDQQGKAQANIMIKKLKYLSEDEQGKMVNFDSIAENSKSDPLLALIGQSYKIKISPNGKVEVVDAAAARGAVKGDGSSSKVAERLLSNDEIEKRHQVIALNDAEKKLRGKGDTWSTVAVSPPGMLRQKSFEKIYTLTDIKRENDCDIATVSMEAVPSSKRAADAKEGEGMTGLFANMFDEKDKYTGKMILNLTTGEIENYQELLKAEWVAIEPPSEQKSDKGPDQLTMGFTYMYVIEKAE